MVKRLLSSPFFIALTAFALRIMILGVSWDKAAAEIANRSYGYELGNIACSIATGRGFSSPFNLVTTGPTAWLGPVYPTFVAGIFKVWGVFSIRSLLIIKIINCFFSAVAVLPIYAASWRTAGRATALLASWLWVVLPTAWYIPIADIWDSTLAALLLTIVFLATLALHDKPPLRAWWFGCYGGLWALAALTSPALLSLFPFFLGWLAWETKKPWPFLLRKVSIALIVFVICLIPWTARNYRTFGKLIPVRSNFGLELWLGNNPEALDVNSFRLHPLWNQSEANKYKSLGEVAYVRAKKDEAIAFILEHPMTALYFAACRFGTNWFAVSDRVQSVLSTGRLYLKVYFVANAAMILCSWGGALQMWRRQNVYRLAYLFVILIYPLVFYFTHTLVRYRFLIDPVLTILASFFIVCAWESIWRRKLEVRIASPTKTQI